MKREKIIPISKVLYLMVCQYAADRDIKANSFLFQNRMGNAYNTQTFSNRMVRTCEKLHIYKEGKRFKAHDIRHTFATYLYEKTDLQTVREYLGHASDEMTKAYIDFIPKRIEDANHQFYEKHGNLFTDVIMKGKSNEAAV